METESKDVKSAEPALIRERCRSGDCEARRGFCPRRLCPEYLAIGKLVSSDGELQLRDLGGKGGTDGAA